MKCKLAILLLMVCTPLLVSAQTPGEQLQQTLAQIETMQARFTQVVRSEGGRAVRRSSGNMALQRPGKFRWDITKPTLQLLVSDGAKLWIYDADLEQVTIKSVKGEVGQTPALFLSGSDRAAIDSYHVRLSGTKRVKYTLTPKSRQASFVSVELFFVRAKLTRMRLVDHLGQTSDIKFSQISINSALSSSLFIFKPPPGVDVIQ